MAWPFDGAYVYAAPVPSEPFIPIPGITWIPAPDPCAPAPCGTEQEIGALKQRVGVLEEQMREMARKAIEKRGRQEKKGRKR